MPKPLNANDITTHLKKLNGWELSGDQIVKSFKFKDFHQTMAFVNAVAWIAHQTNHHPDMEVGYNKTTLHYTTHDAGGLTKADFECAGQVEALGTI